ncbi:hypothetical protein LVJ94_45570 [Pendulispora rubella]|uniref:DUF3052 domain-containing protein n=1 Tax=Pendulispora rubella TaxID=2741070 RepID=A0ABZ2KZQ0_9BACT
MVGYSGTPLSKKLGIKEGHSVVLLGAPPDFRKTLGDVPPGVTFLESLPLSPSADIVLLFVRTRTELEKSFAKSAKRIQRAGSLWVAWPKKASKMATDMTENVAREVGLPLGLVDNKVCAIDEIWSGLRFVWRLENR